VSQLHEPSHGEGVGESLLLHWQEGWDILRQCQLWIKVTDEHLCFPWYGQEQGSWSLEVSCSPQALQCWEHSAQPASTDAVQTGVNPMGSTVANKQSQTLPRLTRARDIGVTLAPLHIPLLPGTVSDLWLFLFVQVRAASKSSEHLELRGAGNSSSC